MEFSVEQIQDNFKKYDESCDFVHNFLAHIENILNTKNVRYHSRVEIDIERIHLSDDKSSIQFAPHYWTDNEAEPICSITIPLSDFTTKTDEQIAEIFDNQVREHYKQVELKRIAKRETEEKRQLAELMQKYAGDIKASRV